MLILKSLLNRKYSMMALIGLLLCDDIESLKPSAVGGINRGGEDRGGCFFSLWLNVMGLFSGHEAFHGQVFEVGSRMPM